MNFFFFLSVLDETNLCNGKPVDGLTTLRNGTLVAFRGELGAPLRSCCHSAQVFAKTKQ